MSDNHATCVDGIWAIGALEVMSGASAADMQSARTTVLVDEYGDPIFFAGVSQCPHCGGTQLLFRHAPYSMHFSAIAIEKVSRKEAKS